MRFIECVLDWFRPKKANSSRAVEAAVDVLSVAPIPPVAAVAPGIVATAPARRSNHIGMQGYAPGVTISRNRTRCEGCKELVFRDVRHICIYNAHHHLDSLTDAERQSLIAQLKALNVKVPAVLRPAVKTVPAKRKPPKKRTRRSLQ